MFTRYGARIAGVQSSAQPTKASSVGPVAKFWMPCDDAAPDVVIEDYIGGLSAPVADFPHIDAGTAPYSIRGLTDGVSDQDLTGGDIPEALASDYMIFVCARAVEELVPDDAADDTGAISLTIGNSVGNGGASGSLVLQPYYAKVSYTPVSTAYELATPWQSQYRARITGEDYSVAVVKRGSYADGHLEHYAQGSFTGKSVNANIMNTDFGTNFWDVFIPGTRIRAGHSSYGEITVLSPGDVGYGSAGRWKRANLDEELPSNFEICCGNSGAICDQEQDYYSIMYFVFPDGAPPQAEIEAMMVWQKADLLAGNKRIYPEWMTL